MGKKGNQNGNSNSGSNSSGAAACLKQQSNRGVLVGGKNTTEYLGYCNQGTKSSEGTSFLEINKSEPKKLGIKLCGNGCGVNEVSESSIQQLENKKEGYGKTVEFYKK